MPAEIESVVDHTWSTPMRRNKGELKGVREITRREDFQVPSVVRLRTATPNYADPERREDPNIKFDLSEGVQPFGLPQFLVEKVKPAMFEGDKWEQAIGKYAGVNLSEAFEFQYKWHGVDRSYAHVAYGNRGSYGGIMDLFLAGTFIAPNQGTIKILDTNIDFPAAYKVSRRYDKEISPYNRMPFYPLKIDLNDSQDVVLEKAIDRVKKEGKRNKKGFVVVYTDPNSPKGNSSTDPSRVEELAYQSNRFGYPIIIDQVFKDNVHPWESFAYLTHDLPYVIVVDSPSKIWGMPGARVGTLIMSKELKEPYEGTRAEHEFSGLTALLAKETFKFEHENEIREWIKHVSEMNETFKRPFVAGLRDMGITVCDTNMKVPVSFVISKNENFVRDLYAKGIKVARGGGFNATYATDVSQALGTAVNRGVLTGNSARMSTWGNYADLPEILDICREVESKAA